MEKEMRPTPRTDAISHPLQPVSTMEAHARTLERELAEAVELLREDFAWEEELGETDRPYYIRLRAFLRRMEPYYSAWRKS